MTAVISGPDDDDGSTFTATSDGGWDHNDTKEYDKWEEEKGGNDKQQTDGEIKDTWHEARNDAQNDPRSNDPDDVGYAGDWSRG